MLCDLNQCSFRVSKDLPPTEEITRQVDTLEMTSWTARYVKKAAKSEASPRAQDIVKKKKKKKKGGCLDR